MTQTKTDRQEWFVGYEDLGHGHRGPATICDSTPKPIELTEEVIFEIVRDHNDAVRMRDVLQGIANCDQSTWESEYRNPEDFKRWAMSISAHALTGGKESGKND